MNKHDAILVGLVVIILAVVLSPWLLLLYIASTPATGVEGFPQIPVFW